MADLSAMDVALSKSDRETLKAVYRLTKGGADAHTGAIAEHLSLAPGTVTANVKRLAERNLVDHRPYKGVELTREGRKLAVAAIRRHRIVERFLSDILGYAWHEADRLAGSFESDLPQEVEDRLYDALGRPATCPHGFPIPDADIDRIPQMPSLVEVPIGGGGVVALSGATEPEMLEFLESLGIRPGATVEVIDRHPFEGPVIVRVGGHAETRTVGEKLAQRIFVQSIQSGEENPGRPEIEPVDALNLVRANARTDSRKEDTQ